MIEQRFFQLVQKKGYFKHHRKILLAISGGRDSMTLLDWLYKYRKKLAIEICLAHVNHGLREESDFEEQELKKIAKKLANSKLFGWICKLCGKNSDTLISRMIKSLTKMTKKLVSKVSNSMIGNAIKKCAKKAVATIGLVIDTGQFLWAWYKGTKNASKYLDMEKDGFTQDWLESKDLNDNVGLHYAWYDSGISLVTSVLATGVEWGSLGTSTASGMSFAIQVVGFIFEQILHAFRSFGNYLKDTDLMKENLFKL